MLLVLFLVRILFRRLANVIVQYFVISDAELAFESHFMIEAFVVRHGFSGAIRACLNIRCLWMHANEAILWAAQNELQQSYAQCWSPTKRPILRFPLYLLTRGVAASFFCFIWMDSVCFSRGLVAHFCRGKQWIVISKHDYLLWIPGNCLPSKGKLLEAKQKKNKFFFSKKKQKKKTFEISLPT